MRYSYSYTCRFTALLIALTLVLSLTVPCLVDAQDMPVPILVQARFFKKVFAYNKTLPKDQIKIAIVYTDASAEAKGDLVEAFGSVGMSVTAVKAIAQAAGVHVVYAAPGVDVKAVRDFCRTNGVLSITGVPKWVKDGDISIAIDAVNDQPKVVVNADRLKTERQDAPDLMRFR